MFLDPQYFFCYFQGEYKIMKKVAVEEAVVILKMLIVINMNKSK